MSTREALVESDTEAASDPCSMCDTLEFSTPGPECCPMCDTPEFSTTPSREQDVVICTGQERRLEDLWSPSSGYTVCDRRCPSPSETILYVDATHPDGVGCSGLTPARTLFWPRCLIHEMARAFRPVFRRCKITNSSLGERGVVRRTRSGPTQAWRGALELLRCALSATVLAA